MKLNRWTVIVALLTLGNCYSWAQVSTSPYSQYGIGEIIDRTTAIQAGMGDVGIGVPQAYSVNTLNPAHLSLNTLSTFEFGMQGESRDLQSSQGRASTSTFGYKYIMMALPIMPYRWTTSISLNPYSNINYNLTATDVIEGTNDETEVNIVGQGGLTEFRFANGVKINESFAVGLRTSFLFGFTDRTITNTLLGTTALSPEYNDKVSYTGFDYGFGFSYRKKLNKERLLFVGATYDMSNDLSGSRTIEFSSNVGGDETIDESVDSNFELPSKLGLGIGLIKENHYTLGVDVTWSQWEGEAGFSNNTSTQFKETLTAGLGLEYVPDYDDISRYFERIRYRFGVKYEQLPVEINGKRINDFGINFGWSLPIRRISSLNMAFKYGGRGTKRSDLIRENYFKFTVGATFSDRWFVRRKYN